MIGRKLLLTVTVILLSWVTSSQATTVVIEDTPNVGDTTAITTVTTGNPVTTNNLLSQNWIDGSWVGTMFPDSSDINENTWLTGKDGKYAETTLNSEDYVTLEELQLGFTSTFGAQIRWWNPVESTVTMTQSISNGIDTTTQSTTFEDTTNSSYQVNPYSNVLTMNPDSEMTHGTATYRFDFDIINNNQAGYNGGHSGVDVRDPTAVIDYTALSSTTVTTVEYCWQKNPPTCPGQDEIEDVQEEIENIETVINDIGLDNFENINNFIEVETVTIDNNWFTEFIEEEEFTYETETLIALPIEDFFFETDFENTTIEIDQPDEIVIDQEFELEDTLVFEEEIIYEEDLPLITMSYDEAPIIEETENFNTEEFIDNYELEIIEEIQYEPTNEEFIEEPYETIVLLDEEPTFIEEEKPFIEETKEVAEEEIYEEEIKEEIIEEVVQEDVQDEPSIKSEPIADQPKETANVTEDPKQELTEEPTEEIIEEEVIEKPTKKEVTIENTKIAQIENAIKSQVKNTTARLEATLTVVNEILNRDIISQQADLSSYEFKNKQFFDNRELPDGNPDFFSNQISLASYEFTIYDNQVSLGASDPVTKHEIKMKEYKSKTNKAYKKYMELKNARNNI